VSNESLIFGNTSKYDFLSSPVSDSQVQPTLILATEDSILSQSSDMLMESPTKIYEANHRIVGMAVFVLKKLIFFADSSQSIYK
jgi:hypothetical protein